MPIIETAQITLKTPTKLVISTFDTEITSHVAAAIRDSGLGFTPVVEGANITVAVAKPSREMRENLIRITAKQGESVCT